MTGTLGSLASLSSPEAVVLVSSRHTFNGHRKIDCNIISPSTESSAVRSWDARTLGERVLELMVRPIWWGVASIVSRPRPG